MSYFLDNLIFSFTTITPVFLIVLLGIFLRYKNILDDTFVSKASKLVFNVALPVFLFLKVSVINLNEVVDIKLLLTAFGGIFIAYTVVWFLVSKFISENKNRGVFIQGSFRSNFAIVGLAIIYNIFGDEGLIIGSIILAVLVPYFNLLSIIALAYNNNSKLNAKILINEMLNNPLIIAVLVSLPFSFLKIELHPVLLKTGDYLSALTLPLALLSIGGGLNLSRIKEASKLAFIASSVKLILIPSIFTYISYLIGFRGIELGVLFVFYGAPTAIVSFIMAKEMGGNEKLAGNIVLISTLFSAITISVGILILKTFNLI